MPLLNRIGAWLMVRGVDPAQPVWFAVASLLLFPFLPSILGVALCYEITTRLDFRHVLPTKTHWAIAVVVATAALVLIGYGAVLLPPARSAGG